MILTMIPSKPMLMQNGSLQNGTTLGADNGMVCCCCLWQFLNQKILHMVPIEGLFTADEETGMTGAFGITPGLLKGDILLNMDSEDEGELYVGCAGGTDANIKLPFKKEKVPAGHVGLKVIIKGLKGGHSGLEIIPWPRKCQQDDEPLDENKPSRWVCVLAQ